MSTWEFDGPYGEDGQRGSAQAGFRSQQARLHWRDLQPLLLRSAGVAGLVGVIMVLISSDALLVGSDKQPPEQAASLMEPASLAQAQETIAVAGIAGSAQPLQTDGFVRNDAGPAENVRDVAPPLTAPPEEVVAAAAPAPPSPVDPAVAAPAPPPIAEPNPTTGTVAAVPQPADATPVETGSPWAEEAMNCARDWMKVHGSGNAGDAAECREAAPLLPELAALETDQRALDEAAMLQASEMAGLQFAPRIPMARPDPPPVRKKTARRANASWPADPPPNCGEKHAYWRFVDRKAGTKEWYCK